MSRFPLQGTMKEKDARGAGSFRRRGGLPTLGAAHLAIALAAIGCEKKAPVSEATVPPAQAELIKRGRTVYQTQCIACHNADPAKPGSLGPEVQGSSRELLDARILRAEYPPGYQPKRATHAMAALPHLKDDIDALHAFLNSK